MQVVHDKVRGISLTGVTLAAADTEAGLLAIIEVSFATLSNLSHIVMHTIVAHS